MAEESENDIKPFRFYPDPSNWSEMLQRALEGDECATSEMTEQYAERDRSLEDWLQLEVYQPIKDGTLGGGGGGGNLVPGTDFPRYFPAEVLSADNSAATATVEEVGVATVFVGADNQSGQGLGPGMAVYCYEYLGAVVILSVSSGVIIGDDGILLPGQQVPVPSSLPAFGVPSAFVGSNPGFTFPQYPSVNHLNEAGFNPSYPYPAHSTSQTVVASVATGPYVNNYWKVESYNLLSNPVLLAVNSDNSGEYVEYPGLPIAWSYSNSTGAVLCARQQHWVSSDAYDLPDSERSFVYMPDLTGFQELPRVIYPGSDPVSSSKQYVAQYCLGGTNEQPSPYVFVLITPRQSSWYSSSGITDPDNQTAALCRIDLSQPKEAWAWELTWQTTTLTSAWQNRNSNYIPLDFRVELGSPAYGKGTYDQLTSNVDITEALPDFTTSKEFPLKAFSSWRYKTGTSATEDLIVVKHTGEVLRHTFQGAADDPSMLANYEDAVTKGTVTENAVFTADGFNLAQSRASGNDMLDTTKEHQTFHSYLNVVGTVPASGFGTEIRVRPSGQVQASGPAEDPTWVHPFDETVYDQRQPGWAWHSRGNVRHFEFPSSYPASASGSYVVQTVFLRHVADSGTAFPTKHPNYKDADFPGGVCPARPGIYDPFIVITRPDGFVQWSQIKQFRAIDFSGTSLVETADSNWHYAPAEAEVLSVDDFRAGGPKVVQMDIKVPHLRSRALYSSQTANHVVTGTWVTPESTFDNYVEMEIKDFMNSYSANRYTLPTDFYLWGEVNIELYPAPTTGP